MSTNLNTIQDLAEREYKWGFVTDIEEESVPKGLNEDIIRLISAKKNEPEFMLEWRLKAYRHWAVAGKGAGRAEVGQHQIRSHRLPGHRLLLRAQAETRTSRAWTNWIRRFCAPTRSWAFRLTSRSAWRAWRWMRCSTASRWRRRSRRSWPKLGVIFCSFSEAVQKHPDLVKKYLGSVVPLHRQFLCRAECGRVHDGSFVYVPKGVRCPMELSTYFRINAAETGQFERTLIVADEGAYVSYLEGCTAPIRDENQLHAAVVELIALDNAQIKYSTVQNWYPGRQGRPGGIYNFVTKRGKCLGVNSKISWTQVETGSAITWKYPSCILQGDNSVGEFYSVALTNNYQQADTGTKMIHIGKNTRSTIVSKGISAGHGQNTYRGQVKILKGATGRAQLHAVRLAADRRPVRRAHVPVHRGEELDRAHGARSFDLEDRRRPDLLPAAARAEGRRRRIDDRERLLQAGVPELPMEFAVEAQKLLGISLEGSVG